MPGADCHISPPWPAAGAASVAFRPRRLARRDRANVLFLPLAPVQVLAADVMHLAVRDLLAVALHRQTAAVCEGGLSGSITAGDRAGTGRRAGPSRQLPG